ncbi:hypothetical protein [Streptomyces sp. NPDC055681]
MFALDDPASAAALVILLASATAVAVSDRLPAADRRWRFPAAIALIAAADITLVLIVATGPDQRVGIVPLLVAVFLGYGVHRRFRAAGRTRPPLR